MAAVGAGPVYKLLGKKDLSNYRNAAGRKTARDSTVTWPFASTTAGTLMP